MLKGSTVPTPVREQSHEDLTIRQRGTIKRTLARRIVDLETEAGQPRPAGSVIAGYISAPLPFLADTIAGLET